MICVRCHKEATPHPHPKSRVCEECFRANVVESLRPTPQERGLWWISFAEPGHFRGVCLVYAESMGQSTFVARQLGCNPGGQCAMHLVWPWNVPPVPVSDLNEADMGHACALVCAPRGVLLSKDDLVRLGLHRPS